MYLTILFLIKLNLIRHVIDSSKMQVHQTKREQNTHTSKVTQQCCSFKAHTGQSVQHFPPRDFFLKGSKMENLAQFTFQNNFCVDFQRLMHLVSWKNYTTHSSPKTHSLS